MWSMSKGIGTENKFSFGICAPPFSKHSIYPQKIKSHKRESKTKIKIQLYMFLVDTVYPEIYHSNAKNIKIGPKFMSEVFL